MDFCLFVDHSLLWGEGNQIFLTQVLEVTANSTSIRKKNIVEILTEVYI